MGIRMDQYMGLTEIAQAMVEGEPIALYDEQVHRFYLDGREEVLPSRTIMGSTVKREESGKFYQGAFDGSDNPLMRYTLPDGRVLTEDVQAEPWSSGPCFFLALRDEKGEWVKESLWADNEIEAA